MELNIDRVTKRFKNFTAVDGFSYTLTNGVYGLLGINGSGKTTLLRLLCTLLKPTAGQITCDGKDILAMGGEYRALIGYLPQDFGCYPEFTARDYLMYISSIKGLTPVTARKRIPELLLALGLDQVGKKKIKAFSGGMRRRLGIAQALLNNPRILIMDEPTAGLDPNERIRIRNMTEELAQDRLVLLSTHIVSDVEGIAKEILLIKGGRLIRSGKPDSLLRETPVNVWKVRTDRSQLPFYAGQGKIANRRTTPEGVELRLVSERRPCREAEEEKVTLEDVFLYYFDEKGRGNDDLL